MKTQIKWLSSPLKKVIDLANISLWLGLLFLSMSWLFFVQIFTPSDWKLGFSFLGVGLVLIILGFQSQGTITTAIDKRYLFVLIGFLISLFFVPFPYYLGLLLISIGLSLHAFYPKRNIHLGISLSGVVFTVQACLMPLYFILAPRFHRIDIFSYPIYFIGKLLGLNVTLSQGIVYVQTMQQLFPFTTTWEKLGVYPWINVFIGCVVFFILFSSLQKSSSSLIEVGVKILSLLLISFLYITLRYIFLIFTFVETNDISIFWSPLWFTGTFIPLALLLAKIYPLCAEKIVDLSPLKSFRVNRNQIFSILAIFLCVFFLVGASGFQDPGAPKNGRILFDDLHSEWESVTEELNTTNFAGQKSVYTYYSLVKWLEHYYYVDINFNRTIDSELLSGYDVLVLECPTAPYSEKEINAIIQFVENGGGLFLIGDHTNLYGMNTYLNDIGRHFGIEFRYDSTFELTTGDLSHYEPPKILPHTIIQHITSFDFATSCSLSAPLKAEEVMVGYGLGEEFIEFSHVHFFGNMEADPEDEYGLFLQTVAIKYGEGRVVAFSDSTTFSSFSMFMGGNPGLVLGTIEYLNRTNQYFYLNNVFLIISIAAFVAAVYFLRKERGVIILLLLFFAGVLAFSSAICAFSYLNEMHYPLPQPHTQFTMVCFDNEHSDFTLLHFIGIPTTMHRQKRQFESFYVGTQRLGYIPSVEQTIEDALKGDIVVIINPNNHFTSDDLSSITHYIEQGGKVLLMDSIHNEDTTAHELLFPFGMVLEYNYTTIEGYEGQNGNESRVERGVFKVPSLSIKGGKPILVTEDGLVFFAVQRVGKGMLAVTVDSLAFSRAVMGDMYFPPSQPALDSYKLEFYILRYIVEDRSM